MKKNLIAFALATATVTGGAWADPAEGVWQTEVDDGSYAYVTVSPCGPAFCGVISRTFKDTGEYKSPNLGKTLVIDMVPQGGGEYKGEVWRPSNDKIYIGKMSVNGNKLDLAGCVLGGLICASQHWTRLQ